AAPNPAGVAGEVAVAVDRAHEAVLHRDDDGGPFEAGEVEPAPRGGFHLAAADGVVAGAAAVGEGGAAVGEDGADVGLSEAALAHAAAGVVGEGEGAGAGGLAVAADVELSRGEHGRSGRS